MRQGESARAIDTGLFAPRLIPFSPRASRAPAKIDQSREPPSISINCETPHHQNEATWEKGWSCEDNLAASEAILFNGGTGWQETRGFQTRLRPLGTLLLLQGQPLKCLIKLNKSKQYI